MAFIYNLLDTWNNAGTVFSGIKLNVTNTASAAGSKLIDLQIGGSTFFNVDKSGQVELLAGTAAAPTLIPTGDTNTGMWFPAADTVAWSTGGSERMRIGSTGNVGIGTSSPGRALQVNSSTGTIVAVTSSTTTANAGPGLRIHNTNTSMGSQAGVGIATLIDDGTATAGRLAVFRCNQLGQFVSDVLVCNFNSNFIALYPDGSERVRITSGGNVGIGTSAPDALLSVNGIASFGDGAAATPSIANFGDLNTGFWFPAADTIAASTAGAERLRVDANGNVVINTAAIATTATNGFLYVPSCAGTPTGTPTTFTGRVPIVVDTTNNKLYFYSGGQWRDAGP